MSRPHEGDIAIACVALLVDELARGGVRHACLTPGSRSTSLALACARHPDIAVHVHVDERSSSYFALGTAKATGVPAVALCTSGTAAVNHFPAVVEASQAAVPLIVITADRPPELHDTGANQTIDQQRLFGDYPRWFADSGVPEASDGAARHWRALGARAVALSTAASPGPVHLNVPFREPLVPAGDAVDLGVDAQGRPAGSPWMQLDRATVFAIGDDISEVAKHLSSTERGVVIAGTLNNPAPSVTALAAALRWPLLAEPASGMRLPGSSLAAGQPLIADAGFRDAHRPDIVLQFGGAPTTRATQALVRDAASLLVVESQGIHADPERKAAATLRAPAEPMAAALREKVTARHSSAWADAWTAADRVARAAVDATLDMLDEPFEGRIARDLAAAIPEGSVLFAGSSMPVRDVDHYMAPREGLRVLANRGASGIDGNVSTLLGIAAAGLPAYGLIGDLAFLHDAAGFLWSARRVAPAVLVVVDNNGGGIFTLLPQADLDPREFESLFVAPHGLDLEAVARAAGVAYRRVSTPSALIDALNNDTALSRVLHVTVDMARASALRADVSRNVTAALAGR